MSSANRGARRRSQRVMVARSVAALAAAGAGLAGLLGAHEARAANGTASYIDFNGATAGFGTPGGTISETATIWSTSNAGTNATTARPTSTQLTIGNVASDFAGLNISINLDGGGNLNGVLINSTSVNVTFTGSSNTHNNAASTWTVPAGSSLTVNDTRQTYADTVKGMNWNNQQVTFQGGGILNFPTPFGANSATNATTENMSGGVVNLQMGAITSTSTYGGGFTLTAGTLNFASAGSANAFNGFTATHPFAINGGIIDNTTVSPITLTVGVGGISVGGDFTFTGTSALSTGTAAVTLTGNRQITVGSNTLTIGGAIGGNFGITKAGAGTLRLTGANTYTGNTTVSAGTLDLTTTGYTLSGTQVLTNNASVLGNISAPAGTTVKGTGTYSGGTVTLTGGTLAPGNSVGAIAMSTLTVGSGTIAIEMSGNTADAITVSGAADFTGYAGTPIAITPLTPVTPGSYIVMTAGSIINSAAVTCTPAIGRTTFAVNQAQLASNIVQIDVAGGPATLTWKSNDGTSPTVWDNTQDVHNWSGTGIGDTTVFFDGDQVTFNGSDTTPPNVAITGTVSPGSIAVSAGTYNFNDTGGASIAGPGSLTVGGTGNLTINTSNTYAGGTTLNAGALTAAAAGALGTGAVTVNAGQLNINNAAALSTSLLTIGGGSIDNTSTSPITLSTVTPIKINSSFTFLGNADGTHDLNLGTGPVTLNTANPTITVSAGTLTIGGVISGTGNGLTKDGSGALVLSAANTYTGDTTANAGILRLTGGGGTGTIRGNLIINAGGTVNPTASNAFGFTSAAVKVNTVAINGGLLDSTATGDMGWGVAYTLTGGTMQTNGGVASAISGSFAFGGLAGADTTVTTVASATTSTIAGRVNLRPENGNPNKLFTVADGAAATDLLISAVITQQTAGAILIKAGPGVMVLSGENTYSGSTNITGGTMALSTAISNNNISTSATVTVASGATLDVTQVVTAGGFILGTNQTLINNGTVAGGITASTAGQTITGTGSFTGGVTVTGGTLTPGSTTAIGTMPSMASLTVNGGVLNIKVSGASSDQITTVTGAASFASNSSITIQQLTLPTAASSTYTVLTAGSISGLTGGGTIQTFGRTVYSVDAVALASNILQIDATGAPGHMVWTGADNATDPTRWDNQKTNANWNTADAVADPTHFYDNDAITFNSVNNNNQFTVNIVGAVSPQSVTVTNGGGTTYTFNDGGAGAIAGTTGLTMNSSDGTGTLIINTANTYTGVTTIASGTISVATVSNGGVAGPLGAASAAAANRVFNGGTLRYTGAGGSTDRLFTLGANGGTIDASGTGALTFAGTGAIAFADTNTPHALTLTGTNTATNIFAPIMGDNGAGATSVVKNGPGTWQLSAANTYTGTTTINAGTLKPLVSTSLGAVPGGSVTVAGGATLDLSANATANNFNFGQKQFIIAGTGANGLGAIFSSGVAQQNVFQVVTLAGNATVTGTGAVTGTTNQGRYDIRAGQVAGVNVAALNLNGFTLTKTGSSQLTLVATTVNAGNIVVSYTGSNPSTDLRPVLGIETTTTIPAATNPDSSTSTVTFNDHTNMELFQTSGVVTRQMIFNGDVLITNGNTGALATVGSPITNNGILRVDAALSGVNNNGAITLSGDISGPGSVIKANGNPGGSAATGGAPNPGTLTLSGNNSYAGGTTVGGTSAGNVLRVGSTNALGSATGTLTVNANGTLDLTAFGPTVGALNGDTGSITSTTAAAIDVLTVGSGGGSGAFGGVISNGLGTVAFTKTGAGTQTLSGINAFGGGVTMAGGTVRVGADNNLGAAAGPLVFNGGALENSASFATARTATVSAGGGTFNTDDATTLTDSGAIGGSGALTKTGNGTLRISGTPTWSNTAVLNASAGTTQLASDSGSETSYALAVNVTPSTGSATLHVATSTTDGMHLRDLRVNTVGAGGAGLVVVDAALTGAAPNPKTGFGAVGGSVATYIGNGTGGSGFATRATIENLWRSAALEGYWALQNHLVTAISRGLTLDSTIVTDNTKNGLVVIPSVDNSNNAATYVGEDIQGDTNGDGKVDINDLGTVLQHLNTAPGSQAGEAGFTLYTPGEGDVNGDLVVNINDLGTVLGHLNQTYSPAASGGGVAAVPEPASMLLIGLGTAALLRRRRR